MAGMVLQLSVDLARRLSIQSRAALQLVVVVDAELANLILGTQESLNKALEPDLSDTLLSHRPGHRTMFSSDTNSPYWRLIRKGTAPAFITANIKQAS